MALSAKLELRQGQQLVMTPQLQQAIRLLQFSNLELAEFVDSELERNPLLEREETSQTKPAEEVPGEVPVESAAGSDDDWLDLRGPVQDHAGGLDADFGNVFQDSGSGEASSAAPEAGLSWSNVSQRMHNRDDDDSNLESYVASEVSLRDHLAAQLPLSIHDPRERLIGQYLIDLVDEAGYISSDLDGLAAKLGAPLEMVEGVLNKMQAFDPPGVFARTLAECLGLQLKDQNRYDPLMAALLANLSLLANRNIAGLKKAVGIDMDELADMIQEIKRLNPKPGLKFGSVQMQPVVPDVIVRAASDGGWHIELNSDTLPRVLVNRNYYTRVTQTASTEKDKGYILECLQTANWLVKSLDQRARTILKVAEQIVRQQDGFFVYGVQHLRPLNLKTVADAISMHESTVSRVTSNKYIATPRGIFELKYFFTSAIASSEDGDAHSSEAVRHRIKIMIDSEGTNDILSDDKLVEKLKDNGIDIARRTVAKYREVHANPILCAAPPGQTPNRSHRRHGICALTDGPISKKVAWSQFFSIRDLTSALSLLNSCDRLSRVTLKPGNAGDSQSYSFGIEFESVQSKRPRACRNFGSPISGSTTTGDPMTIQITGKNVEVGDAYQAYVADKIRAVLNKYVSRDLKGHVRLEKERGLFKTNCSVRLTSGLLLEAHGEGGDAYSSADAAVERLETRVRRYKRRLKSHDSLRTANGRQGDTDARDYVVSIGDDDADEAVENNPLIIAETQRNVQQLTVSEAVMHLDLTEAAFMIFRNAANGTVNLVYRRPDGNIGWIDTEPGQRNAGEAATFVTS